MEDNKHELEGTKAPSPVKENIRDSNEYIDLLNKYNKMESRLIENTRWGDNISKLLNEQMEDNKILNNKLFKFEDENNNLKIEINGMKND